MGATFKENISDIRNSKVGDIINELKSFGTIIDVIDPYAKNGEVKKEYGFEIKEKAGENYDVIIVAVNHKEYMDLDEEFFISISNHDPVLIDVKGIYRNKIKKIHYWSL